MSYLLEIDGETVCKLHGTAWIQGLGGGNIVCGLCAQIAASGPMGSHRNYEQPTERLEDRDGYPFAGARRPTATSLSDGAQLGGKIQFGLGQDTFAKLAKGEPCFILRGQDLLAPTIVRMWCELQAHNPTCPPEKIRQAREIALAMERYPNRKYPD